MQFGILLVYFVFCAQILFVCAQENVGNQFVRLRQEVESDLEIEVLGGKVSTSVDILILVQSQQGEYHSKRSELFKADLKSQVNEEIGFNIGLVRLHETEIPGSWALFPIFKRISNVKWIIVCEDSTRLNLNNIAAFLTEKDHNVPQYFGRCLRDKKITIIHHFGPHTTDFNTFDYPLFASGTIFSISLMKLFNNIELNQVEAFTIDIQHEIALYIFNHFEVRMSCDGKFCIEKADQCLAWVNVEMNQGCDKREFDPQDLTIAVKTYSKNYKTRLPLIIGTWLVDSPKTRFFTHSKKGTDKLELLDFVDVGFKNTGGGHCEKVQYIMKHFFYYEQSYWLGIVDDDTFINIERLGKILSCHEPAWEAVVIGERYGYLQSNGYGYSYISGGGGIFMSRKAVDKFLKSPPKCVPGTADDMWLGMHSDINGVKTLHYPNFHQTVAEDYHKDYVKCFKPVSYHRLKTVAQYQNSLKG